jgi:hypothetical protein
MTETTSKSDKPSFTHTAWILKTELMRKGRRVGRWIDEGVARIESDGSINVYVHSLPIGGWGGHIYLTKIGDNPPDFMSKPQRPGEAGEEDDAEA